MRNRRLRQHTVTEIKNERSAPKRFKNSIGRTVKRFSSRQECHRIKIALDRPLRLNLALVLDVSGSMYEEDGTGVSRLQRVQHAASAALD